VIAARTSKAATARAGSPQVVLALLCAVYLIVFVNRVNVAAVGPLIKSDLRLSNTQLGLAFSAFAIPYALFQLIGGWIGDKFGPRRTLAVCCVLIALATILTGAAGGLSTLIAVRLAMGFAQGAVFPTATRAMSAWIPSETWGFAQGITHSFGRIGNAVTPPLMAALLLLVTWRRSFLILGLASLLWPLGWLWYVRDDPRGQPDSRSRASSQIPWLRLAWRMLPVTVVDFCYGWTLWLFLSWIPGFFYENYHLNLQSSALFSAGVLFAGVLGDTAGGILTDRLLRKTGNVLLARRSVIVAGFIGALAWLCPVVLIHNLALAALGLSLAFFFAELIVGPIWAVSMDIAPRHAGTAGGMMNFGFGLAGLVSPSSFGYLVDRTGSWVLPFLCSMALLLVGALLAWRLRPDRPFLEETIP